MSLIIFYSFAMPWAVFGDTRPFERKQWSNSDETVMEQWCNSDASELSSFMSFSSFWDVMDSILSFCHALEVLLLIWWWHKTYCQKQWWDIDETLMRQWWNSDATVMLLNKSLSNLMSLASFWDVIDHFLSFNNTLEVWLLSSDQTVMRQWWICDATVMPSIWANLCDLQGSDMSSIIFYPFAMPGGCVWWHKTSDETVMEQWWDSDQTMMPLILALYDNFKLPRNHWSNFILQQCLATVMPSICAILCDMQGSDMSLIIFYPFAMPWRCVWWHKTSDETVMEQWWGSDQTMMPLISALYDNFKLLRNHWSNFILQQCLGSVFGDTRPFDKNSDQTEMRQ
jgi:hypothetical protein